MSGVLLDTNAFLRIVLGQPIGDEARTVVGEAARREDLWLSTVSGWEIGMLITSTRTGRLLQIVGDPMAWFEQSRSTARVKDMTLRADEALRAALLPDPFHKDPADRLLVSQARSRGMILVTRDRAILDYAVLGHVRAIAC